MFTTEQYILKNGAWHYKIGRNGRGTRLARDRSVHKAQPYRIITIAAGIGVAVIIAITLWHPRRTTALNAEPASLSPAATQLVITRLANELLRPVSKAGLGND